jgi:hypothetical protein
MNLGRLNGKKQQILRSPSVRRGRKKWGTKTKNNKDKKERCLYTATVRMCRATSQQSQGKNPLIFNQLLHYELFMFFRRYNYNDKK